MEVVPVTVRLLSLGSTFYANPTSSPELHMRVKEA